MIDTTELTRELLYQLRLGEDSAYEFKAVKLKGKKVVAPHRDSTADEIAAFANTGGGILVLGVDDKTKELHGIAIDKLDYVDQWLGSLANDSIDPPPLIQTRLLEIPDRNGELKAVIWVRVSKSVFVHKSPSGYYHRVGSSKREMAPDLLARMFQQRSMSRMIRFDEQIVNNAPLELIDSSLKERFLRENDLPEKVQLKKLYLIGTDDEQQEFLTVSGVMLLTAQPSDYLPSAWVQCVAYSGTERNAEFQADALECRRSIDQQIEDAFNFIKRNMKTEAVKRPGRIDVPQYDLGAIYEAIVNAIAHRDYSIYGAKVRLHMFSDRLEIMTPGGLPNSLTVNSMDANSITRNETLVNLLSRYFPADPVTKRQNIIERRGEGVPKIISASKALSLRQPIYEQAGEVGAELKLTIFAASKELNGLVEQFDE